MLMLLWRCLCYRVDANVTGAGSFGGVLGEDMCIKHDNKIHTVIIMLQKCYRDLCIIFCNKILKCQCICNNISKSCYETVMVIHMYNYNTFMSAPNFDTEIKNRLVGLCHNSNIL